MLSQERATQTDQVQDHNRRYFGITGNSVLKFLSSLILPLMLGVFTIVVTFEQQKVARQQRLEDKNESQLQRQQAWDIAQTAQATQDKASRDRYQDEILIAYIKELGELLKENNGSLTVDPLTHTLARVKTLNTLRQLDGFRQLYVLRFLKEARQLTDANNSIALDISTAELADIDFRRSGSLLTNGEIVLLNVSVTNSMFGDMDLSGVKFSFAQLDNVNFSSARLVNVIFSSGWFDNANFSSAELHNVNFSSARFDNVNFSSVGLANVNFSPAWLDNVNFSSARFDNVNFSSAWLSNVKFSSARLDNVNCLFAELIDVNFSSAELIDVNFSSARLHSVNFSSARLDNGNCSSAELIDVNFSSTRLANVNFSSARLENVKFSSAWLSNVKFSSARLDNVNFSSARLINVNFSSAQLYGVDFSSAQLYNGNFSSARFDNVNFSSAWLSNVKFSSARLDYVNFSSAHFPSYYDPISFDHSILFFAVFDKCDLHKTDFAYANLEGSSFHSSNISSVNFSHANLQNANLINTKITDSQLQSALSIRNAKLPNGTLGQGRNLIGNGGARCNISILDHWRICNGSIAVTTSNNDQSQCRFSPQSPANGATMSQQINLIDIWDSSFWKYSNVELRAQMSIGISIELSGQNSYGSVVRKAILNSTKNEISMSLLAEMEVVVVMVKYKAQLDQNDVGSSWCDNIELFLNYGTW